MVSLKSVTLVLFFTEGVSLRSWYEDGLFEREVALYRALLPHLRGITFVTYGDRRDLDYAVELGGIRVICNRFTLPRSMYKVWLTAVCGRMFRGSQVLIKTNQSLGGETAMSVAKVSEAPLVARGGYLLSDFARRQYGQDSLQLERALKLEQRLFGRAARIVVTTEAARELIVTRHPESAARLRVIPNYVDTRRFRPATERQKSDAFRVSMVGRLEEQKNPLAMVEAMAGIDAELIVAGTGPLEVAMRQRAEALGVRTTFMGRVPHKELSGLFNSCDVYMLASHYEGHPKTLLEAMSCGLPVLGASSPGISEVIRHGDTGLLVERNPEAIKKGLQRLLADEALRDRLGRNARRYIERTVALDRIVAQELELYAEIEAGRPLARSTAGLTGK